jgi:hypothetical protein
MTPEERQLVTGLFDRMRSYSLPEKDGEAEALIDERVRAVPDAPYMLVQSVLVQEQALQEAESRIRALEEQVRELDAQRQQRPAGAGSFLGGLFGSRTTAPAAEPARSPSVPVVGARATPSVYAGGQPGQPGAQTQAPWQSAPPPGQAAQSGGGGFLRTAMATAAGVAGGMLIAGAIRDLISPAHANPAGAAASPAAQPAPASEPASPAPEAATPVDEDSSWFDDGGGDFGGDFDI